MFRKRKKKDQESQTANGSHKKQHKNSTMQ